MKKNSIVLACSGGVDTSLISTNGSYDFTITTTASTDVCRVQGNIDFIGSIDNISVKRVIQTN